MNTIFYILINRFSINFCIDDCECPIDIAYHFKTIFEDSKSHVVHNYKTGFWNEEVVEESSWIDGRGK